MSEENEKDDVIDITEPGKFDGFKKKFIKGVTSIVIVLFVLIALLGSFYKVDTGSQAVVTRFDKVIKVVETEGLHLKVPIIDGVSVVNMENRHFIEYGYTTEAIGDENTVANYRDVDEEALVIVGADENNSSILLINLIVSYKVSDAFSYLYKVSDLEGTLKLALEDVLRNTIQTYTVLEALTNKESIDKEIFPELQAKMNSYEAGIEIVEVKTQNTMLLPSVNEAYEQVEKANQYKNGKLEEAQKYRNTIVPLAKSESAKLIEEAKGYRAEVIADAKADVAQFNALYNEYLKNPDIVKEKYYVSTMEKLLTNNELVIDTTKDSDIYKFYNMDNDKNIIKENIANEGGQ